MAEKIKSPLNRLKKEYEKFRKKYSLPKFRVLNEDFDISRVADVETDTLLREIRKAIADKIISYLRFLELFLNSTQSHLFFFFLIKSIEVTDKKLIEEIYIKLGKIEIEIMELDNQYNEKKEAEFIKRIYKEWQEIKNDMNKLISSFKKGWKKKLNKKKGNYFG